MSNWLQKVISGGQTGVDRAALDTAVQLGIDIGGWCPRGRLAEDGIIPERYPLIETKSPEPHVRTQRNVEASSATLVITRGAPTGGTRFTVEVASSMCRPILVIDLAERDASAVDRLSTWLEAVQPRVLNVAGPRESGAPGIADETSRLLRAALARTGLVTDRAA